MKQYHLTFDYVVWCITWVNIQMIMHAVSEAESDAYDSAKQKNNEIENVKDVEGLDELAGMMGL